MQSQDFQNTPSALLATRRPPHAASPLERAALASEQCDLIAWGGALSDLDASAVELESLRLSPLWLRLAVDPAARATDERSFVTVEGAFAPIESAQRAAFIQAVLGNAQRLAPENEAIRAVLPPLWLGALSDAVKGDDARFLSLCSAPLAVDLLVSSHWRQCAWHLGANDRVETVLRARSALAPIQSLEAEELVQMAFIGASACNQSDAARAFLDCGADLNAALAGRSGAGARPGNAFEQAIAHNSLSMAEELLALGAKTLNPNTATDALLSYIGQTETPDLALNILERSGARFNETMLFKASLALLDQRMFDRALFLIPRIEPLMSASPETDLFWRVFCRSCDVPCVQEGRWKGAVSILLSTPLSAPSANGLQVIHEEFARLGRDPSQLAARARAIEEIASQCDAKRDMNGQSLMEAAEQRDLLRRSFRPREERAPGSSRPEHYHKPSAQKTDALADAQGAGNKSRARSGPRR